MCVWAGSSCSEYIQRTRLSCCSNVARTICKLNSMPNISLGAGKPLNGIDCESQCSNNSDDTFLGNAMKRKITEKWNRGRMKTEILQTRVCVCIASDIKWMKTEFHVIVRTVQSQPYSKCTRLNRLCELFHRFRIHRIDSCTHPM